jgi:hypothetical protein
VVFISTENSLVQGKPFRAYENPAPTKKLAVFCLVSFMINLPFKNFICDFIDILKQ